MILETERKVMDHIDVVDTYFDAWLRRKPDILSDVFADDVIFCECYGPEYRGLKQIQRWFTDWNLRGTVLRWDIKNRLGSGNALCVGWYFQCEYDGVTDGFDGVSWIEFDGEGKIKALREFQSKTEHRFPYGQI